MLYTIADLHLSHTAEKPMDIFGEVWRDHQEKLRENWCACVRPEDTVVIPGDISWGMKTDDALSDLRFLDALPGVKIVGKGNHDYWWQTQKKLTSLCSAEHLDSLHFLFNNAYFAEGFILCGTRGWLLENQNSPENALILNREEGRLRLSLEEGKKLSAAHPEAETLVFLHYPPAYGGLTSPHFAALFAEYGIKRCYYGHLHGAPESRLTASLDETRLFLISADHLRFRPIPIFPR